MRVSLELKDLRLLLKDKIDLEDQVTRLTTENQRLREESDSIAKTPWAMLIGAAAIQGLLCKSDDKW